MTALLSIKNSICLISTILSLLGLSVTVAGETKVVSDSKDGVILSVSYKSRVKAGHSAFIICTIENKTKFELQAVVGKDRFRDFVTLVRRKNGDVVGRTAFGLRYYREKAEGGYDELSTARKPGRRRDLKPGEKHSVRINLSRLFDLSVPADYTLSVEALVTHITKDPIKVRSWKPLVKDIKFEVIEDKPQAK